MAINKNHEFEELDGKKCGIVEKNVLPERVEFLKKILEYNHYTVVVVPSPPPKTTTAPVTVSADTTEPETSPTSTIPASTTFTIGVTDYTFNTINAIFGRLLKTPEGQIVTLSFWQQKDLVNHDEIPYYEHK